VRRGRLRRLLPLLAFLAGVGFFLVYGSLERSGPAPRLAGLAAQGGQGRAVVVEVVDGDTVRLRDGRQVRLVQIDAPEAQGECYGREARQALLALLPLPSSVRLETDPALDRRDRYGRLLAYLYRDGLNVNLALVRRGAAAPYFYRGARGRYAAQLLKAARLAQAERRGLWAACPRTRLEPARALAARP
jgi:endonuclease YncB( thermonuclease family)